MGGGAPRGWPTEGDQRELGEATFETMIRCKTLLWLKTSIGLNSLPVCAREGAERRVTSTTIGSASSFTLLFTYTFNLACFLPFTLPPFLSSSLQFGLLILFTPLTFHFLPPSFTPPSLPPFFTFSGFLHIINTHSLQTHYLLFYSFQLFNIPPFFITSDSSYFTYT